MRGQTTDGHIVTTIEQEGAYTGEDIGRLWISAPTGWTWYGCETVAQQQRYLALAQTMTATEFDQYFDAAEA